MEETFRPEALDLFSYVLGGFFLTMVLAFVAFVISFVLCYLISLCWRCASAWPAANRAGRVVKTTIYATVATLLAAAILNPDGPICPCRVAGVAGAAIFLTLLYALYTTPRTVRELRQEEAEREQKEDEWRQRDQQHSLAG